MGQEFDKFSKSYEQVLDSGLKTTGFDASYFVTAKVKKLRRLTPSLCDAPVNFLDYGCGTGSLCEGLHEFFPKANYFGVDVSGEMIKQARSKHHGLGVFDEIGSREWKERAYNIIFASGVFHHIPHDKHEGILNQLKGVLAPAGKVIIWEDNPINPFTQKIVRDCAFDRDAVLVPSRRMKYLLTEAQLLPARIIYTTFFPKFLEFLIPVERFLEWLPLGAQYVAIGESQPGQPQS